jgi:hypothetical protein
MAYLHELKCISQLTLAGSVAGAILSVAMIGRKLGQAAIHGESVRVVIVGIVLFFCSGMLSLVSVGAAHLAKKERDPAGIPWLPIFWLVLALFCFGTIAILVINILRN